MYTKRYYSRRLWETSGRRESNNTHHHYICCSCEEKGSCCYYIVICHESYVLRHFAHLCIKSTEYSTYVRLARQIRCHRFSFSHLSLVQSTYVYALYSDDTNISIFLINPWHAYAARVTVVVLCVCVCLDMLFWHYVR